MKSSVEIVSWEPEGRYCSSKMFRWEPEGHYFCTKSMAIAPFWFSTEHLWSALAPFWLSADEISVISYYFLTLSQASECKSCTKFGQVEELMGRDNAEQAPMDDWIWYAVTKWTKRDIAQYRSQYKTCSNITKRDLWCFSEHVHIDMSYYEISEFPISFLYVDMLWEFPKTQQQNAYLNYICQLYFVFMMFILDNRLVVDHMRLIKNSYVIRRRIRLGTPSSSSRRRVTQTHSFSRHSVNFILFTRWHQTCGNAAIFGSRCIIASIYHDSEGGIMDGRYLRDVWYTLRIKSNLSFCLSQHF